MKLIFFAFFIFCTLIGCRPESKANTEEQNPKPTDTIVAEIEPPKIIDSVRMHAFDNLYFGKNPMPKSGEHSVDGSQYILKETTNSKNGLSSFLLMNDSNIITHEKVITKLQSLQKIISNKYGNGQRIAKTIYVKHVEQTPESDSFFDYRSLFNYSTVNIGLPSEYIAYKWNLPFKTIQIGYFVDYKKGHPMVPSNQSSDYYKIYLEITSNIIKPDKKSKDKSNDSDKF